ncbi:MAG: ABC transporter ATP-binding protein [Clostridia bacterium]|nr:ABC transporter ATP-binding protein [Clostridia bacterium]
MNLEFYDLSCGYRNSAVIKDISLTVEEGDVLCLLGPNGSGKTTFFKTILGLLKCQKGGIYIDGHNIKNWSHAKIARSIGYIPQSYHPQFPFKVIDIVLMGRTAHLGAFASPSQNDVEIAEKAIDVLNINYLRDRTYTQISGGERQLVLIARALAQQAPILLMDEPTASLDFGNQVMVLSRIQQLANSGLSIIMACHFPEHAFLYANKALLFKQGEVFGFGTPDKVVSKANIKALYGVDVEIAQFHTQQGNAVKMCVPCNLNNNHKISLGRLNHA